MFTLSNNKDELVLRPEGTAGVIRSFIQNKLYVSPNETVKLFYKGNMFRSERPQAGRQREFTQIGIEALGKVNAFTDAEIIALASNFFETLSLENIRLSINSIGCTTCRGNYVNALKTFLFSFSDLCEDCNTRKEKNPLRALDCKNDSCREKYKNAPIITDFLCDDCQFDFDQLKQNLNNLAIAYTVDPTLVRGLDYYNGTVFEFIDDSIGAQSTVCAGGRYTGLVKELGGPDISGTGFAFGLERLLISLSNQDKLPSFRSEIDYYLVWTNDETKLVQMKIAQSLRKKGFAVEMEFFSKKMKNQLKVADRKNAKYALILGEDELLKNTITCKNLETGEQEEKSLSEFL
jgi:histidyl-tRNA synthetase